MTHSLWAPLSYGQEALWFMQQASPQSRAYNTGTLLQIHSAIDVALWRQLIQALAQRHPALRTTFALRDGQPMQIARATPVPFEQIDCSGQSWDAVMQTVEQVLWRPYDLEQGPLFCATLVSHRAESHVLLLSSHHIINDGLSQWMLLDELLRLYALAKGADSEPLPPIRSTYAEFVEQERQSVAANLDSLHAFWLQALAGELVPLDLPLDHPRPHQHSGRAAALPFCMSASLRDQLRALAHREGVSFYTVQLAAFHVLLHRYTGQTDILVGVPVSLSDQVSAQIFGYFINPLVVRSSATNMPFTDFLQQIRARLRDAVEHRDYPFSLLAQQIQHTRDSSRAWLFQASFIGQRLHALGTHSRRLLNGERLEVADLACSLINWWAGGGELDLSFELTERTSGMAGYIRYNPQIFDPASIERIGRHYRHLLAGIVANPAARIDDLPLLSDAERQLQLVAWNPTQTPYPADRSLNQLFEEQVARSPTAVAVIFEQTQLTYLELNQQANQLASYLRSLGVGPEQPVGLYIERSAAMIVGLLGILKAGGAYLPLDPVYPAERLAFMLEDAQVATLVTQASLLDQLPRASAGSAPHAIVCLDRDWASIAAAPTENFASGATPANLAYVIYTSGSTGRPKGTLVEHRGIGNLAAAQIRAFDLRPDSRVLQFASLSFDAALAEIVMTLLGGATLCLAPQAALLPGPGLLQLLRDQAITTVTLPPLALAVLSPEELPALRTIAVAGEACPPTLAERWAPGRRFLNAYGPTETTVCATMFVYAGGAQLPIGRPIANTQIYLLDKQLQPVPIGVSGELYIGGIGLARGYLGRPDLTAERFVPNPFVKIEDRGWRIEDSEHSATLSSILYPLSSRLYRTGDLARYRPDGTIEFVGRADQQIKIRGFRIELGEIESLLRQHPAVQECIVVAQPDRRGERRLVAYVVPVSEDRGSKIEDRQAGAHESPSSILDPRSSILRAFLQTQLPEHMLPTAFVALDALPITPNGKVDRRALPPPDWSSLATEAAYLAPRTATEARLAEIWCEVLGLARVGVDDRFFDVGGHSLLATQITNQVAKAFGVELPLRSLFEAPTIASLAAQIDQLMVIELLQQPLADTAELREELAL